MSGMKKTKQNKNKTLESLRDLLKDLASTSHLWGLHHLMLEWLLGKDRRKIAAEHIGSWSR
jgi:hypothetical protein